MHFSSTYYFTFQATALTFSLPFFLCFSFLTFYYSFYVFYSTAFCWFFLPFALATSLLPVGEETLFLVIFTHDYLKGLSFKNVDEN
jgi:hypothetical protein